MFVIFLSILVRGDRENCANSRTWSKIDWAYFKYMYKYINVGLGGYEQREPITNFLAQQTT